MKSGAEGLCVHSPTSGASTGATKHRLSDQQKSFAPLITREGKYRASIALTSRSASTVTLDMVGNGAFESRKRSVRSCAGGLPRAKSGRSSAGVGSAAR